MKFSKIQRSIVVTGSRMKRRLFLAQIPGGKKKRVVPFVKRIQYRGVLDAVLLISGQGALGFDEEDGVREPCSITAVVIVYNTQILRRDPRLNWIIGKRMNLVR